MFHVQLFIFMLLKFWYRHEDTSLYVHVILEVCCNTKNNA